MARPHFAPGSRVTFPVRNRSGIQGLDVYLGSRLGVVTPWARDLLARGHVRLNGAPADADTAINLSAGPHEIEVYFPADWPRHMAATAMNLDIVYEDDILLVINKPPGIVVHPARGHLDNQTLLNGVRHRYQERLAFPDTTIGSPHRLDKDTSGAIVFALRRDVYVDLVEQFTHARPHKEYIAILDGCPDFDSLVCDRPIGNDPEHKGRGTIVPVADGGKTARTDFSILQRGDGWAVARAVPHTGRPHQIRIHAASLGLPIAGDRDYNPVPERHGLARQGLHAAALTFRHPVTGCDLRVEAPLSADLTESLDRMASRGDAANG